MLFRTLGPLEVESDGRLIVLPRGRARALLALLLVHVGEVVAGDRLIDELWGDSPPATARTKLHGLISTLRRTLVPDGKPESVPLLTRPPGYVLLVGEEQIDAHRFRRLLAKAKDAPLAEREDLLRDALGLWRGQALADFTYEHFAQAEITALEEMRLSATEDLIDTELALGRHRELTGKLQALVARHPFRERFRGQLILALSGSGRRAEALETYRKTCEEFAEELGCEPGRTLQDIAKAVENSYGLSAPTGTAERMTDPDLKQTPRPWLPRSRKLMTVVFTELSITSSAAAQLDPEASQRMMGLAYEKAVEVFTRHGGTVEGMIGGVVVAVFGVPVAHEDDALRAARGALELDHTLARPTTATARGLPVVTASSGINTGEVVVGGPLLAPTTQGDTVRVAARLQQAAAAGEILIGDGTRSMIAFRTRLERADAALASPGDPAVAAWRLLDVDTGPASSSRSDSQPAVGREGELLRLRRVYDRVERYQRPRIFTVVGEAGAGKSRLIEEFATDIVETRIATGHCLSYGEGITFWPLREIILQLVPNASTDSIAAVLSGEPDALEDARRIAGSLGLTADPVSPTELFPAFRKLFERLAADRPLVVVLEDVHWAEATLLDLASYLEGAVRGPLLLVCVARNEFLESHRAWMDERESESRLRLEPLGREECRELVTRRLAGHTLAEDKVDQVIDLSEGNPLYILQLTAALRRGEDVTPVPASLRSLLAARLDRLGPAERDTLRCASVLGKEFVLSALNELVPPATRPFVGRYLSDLNDRELIQPSIGDASGPIHYEFRHVLIQQAAYRSITLHDRSDLHERFADWLEREAEAGSVEHEELSGYHLEQACRQRRRLGIDDERTQHLAVRAGRRLARGGLRSLARLDVRAAINLLSRTRSLLPVDHPDLAVVLEHLPQALQMSGRHHEADQVLGEALDSTVQRGSEVQTLALRLERIRIQLFTGPDPTPLATIRAQAQKSLETLRASENHAGASQAADVLGQVYLRLGSIERMEEIARGGLSHALQSHSPRQVIAARFWVALAVSVGPKHLERCISECEELMQGDRFEHPLVLALSSKLLAARGNFDGARTRVTRARQLLVERVRARRPLMFTHLFAGEVDIIAGAPLLARESLRKALALAREFQESQVISNAAGLLAGSLRADSHELDGEEIDRLAETCRERSPAEDVETQSLWRCLRARLLAHRGRFEEAERLARQGAELLPPEMPGLRADRKLDYAEVLAVAGQKDAAATVADEARDLYHLKGHRVGVERTSQLSERL